MALRWAIGGSNFLTSASQAAPGFFTTEGPTRTSAAPSGRSTTFGWSFGNASLTTPNLGGNYTTLFAGAAFYGTTALSAQKLIDFIDNAAAIQVSLRIDAAGLVFFTRGAGAGTNLGAGAPTKSTVAVTPNAWNYLEMKCIFATGATGTIEARLNGTVILTLTSVQTGVTLATGSVVNFGSGGAFSTGTGYIRDMYAVDGDGGSRTSYLGDVTVAEMYPNAAGVNSNWTSNPAASFTLTSVNTAGVYQGTITGGASNAYAGLHFVITGFVNGANNITGLCSASSATSITLISSTTPFGAVTTTTETHAGTATFESIVQAGIHGGDNDAATTNLGTRPNADVQYMSSSTTNQQQDYGHQALALTGTIAGVIHVTYARKDDAGTRQIAQQVISTGTTETGSTLSLASSYTYYLDVLEQDPHTSADWVLANFNAATAGWKEIT